MDFSWCFGLFLTIQYGRFFILVILGHTIEKKSWKISSSKKGWFQGWPKLAQFLLFEFWGLPTLCFNYLRHGSLKFENSCAHLVANFLNFLKLPQHFEFALFWMILWTKIKKNGNQKIFNFFWEWDYSSFFFNHMPQKYQNEKSPILNGQKQPKTPGKV